MNVATILRLILHLVTLVHVAIGHQQWETGHLAIMCVVAEVKPDNNSAIALEEPLPTIPFVKMLLEILKVRASNVTLSHVLLQNHSHTGGLTALTTVTHGLLPKLLVSLVPRAQDMEI